MLQHIEAGSLLPPLVVLSILAKNPRLQLRTVKEYVARQLATESAHIQEDRAQIAKYQQETTRMRAEVHQLRTQVKAFSQKDAELVFTTVVTSNTMAAHICFQANRCCALLPVSTSKAIPSCTFTLT